ncbi:hypothetical protein LB521_26795 [Mesorhizobium sp. BR-1-1-8]|uniref:hypothetical protein n=1 Tax=Mesorhizobium sp. BR-1-1-8 TaxID=2876659 RepID=UPI001CCC7AC2|nr:hypothetical protein [Mesorhizobium sp. BR-1-1-8]MBZ9984743.1 hypothetical protein [Mesorhizobium sp. BR-1-1-8]
MSAFIAAVGEHSAILITDGASYNDDGVVVAIGPKVTVGKVAPIAVTTRGSHVFGKMVQQAICDQADEFGVDYALANFAREFPNLKADPAYGGVDIIHVHIVAWSLTHGPIQMSAHNCQHAFGDGQEPLTVTAPVGHYVAGNRIDPAGLRWAGVRSRMPDEDIVDFLSTEGVKIMEAMRLIRAMPVEGDSWEGDQYLIGGQCDVSTVSLWGAKTETVRTWSDAVGQKIVPDGIAQIAA